MNVYKPCDIRGDATSELNPELYYRWGRCLGARLTAGSVFIVGGDVRTSTPSFLQALGHGLQEAGLPVLDLGIVPTPMVYFAKRARNAAGCAIVTASHSPPDMNGLKWMLGTLPPTQDDIRRLQQESEAFGRAQPNPHAASIEQVDLSIEYLGWLKIAFGKAGLPKRSRVVLDPGNGCWSGRALPFLREIFPEIGFSAIHDQPDGTFPHRHPDSARPENLERLAETVRNEQAGLGIAFDGDGDRVAFVDREGIVLSAEEATSILLQGFGDELRARGFVYDLKFSDRIPETALELGATPIVERSGHAFIRTRMVRENALFGAEISGHYFYEELDGGDDGLYTACRMISYLADSNLDIDELRKQCPDVFMTPDLRVSPPDGDHHRVIRDVKTAFTEYPQSFLDGVRVDFTDGWALVRSSVTEDALTFRFEGKSAQSLDTIINRFCNALPEIAPELRKQFNQSKGIRTSYERDTE